MFRCGVALTRFSPQSRCIAPFIKQQGNKKAFQVLRCLSSPRDVTTDAGSATRGHQSGNHRSYALIGAAAAVGVSLYTLWRNGCAHMEAATGDKQTTEKASATNVPGPQARGPAPPYPDLDSQPDIPGHAQYLIIGGGTAANAASKAIRARDPTAKVLIITEEEYLPYMRPPLSKELWFHDDEDVHLAQKFKFKSWSGKTRSIFHQGKGFYVNPKELPYLKNGGIAVATGRKVVKLDPYKEKAILDNGWEVHYDKCLIATGGQPRNLPVIKKAGVEVEKRTTLFRKAADFKKLYSHIENVKSVAVIGGGFLGSELAVALANKGKKNQMKVSQVFPEAGVLGVVLPEYLSKWTTERIKEEGVDVVSDNFVIGASFENEQVQLALKNGEKLSVDHIIVAVGIEPNVDLGKLSGLEVDDVHGGYRVNAELQARTNIWVAGDVCSFYDIKLGRRRVEHHDHAVVSGRLVGENMTGAAKPYWHQSMFWSDLGPQVGFEAIGLVDSRLPTVAVFAQASAQDTPQARDIAAEKDAKSETTSEEPKPESTSTESQPSEVSSEPSEPVSEKSEPEPTNQITDDYGKGVVFYMKDDIIVGVVTWNVFGHMSIARKLLGQEHKDLAQVAKLFGLFKTEESAEQTEAEKTPKEAEQTSS